MTESPESVSIPIGEPATSVKIQITPTYGKVPSISDLKIEACYHPGKYLNILYIP